MRAARLSGLQNRSPLAFHRFILSRRIGPGRGVYGLDVAVPGRVAEQRNHHDQAQAGGGETQSGQRHDQLCSQL